MSRAKATDTDIKPGRRVNVFWKATGEALFDEIWPPSHHEPNVYSEISTPPKADQILRAQKNFASFGRDTGGGCVRRLMFRDAFADAAVAASVARNSAFADDNDVVETRRKCLELVCGENEWFIVCVAELCVEDCARGYRDMVYGNGGDVVNDLDRERKERKPELTKFVKATLKHFAALQRSFEYAQTPAKPMVDRAATPIDQRDYESAKNTGGSGTVIEGHVTTTASQPTGSSDPLTVDAQAESSNSAADLPIEANGHREAPKREVRRAPINMSAVHEALQLIRNNANL